MAKRIFGLSSGWLTAILIALFVVALALIAFADGIKGFWGYFWSALGAAILSTVLALVISEFLLRPLLIQELLSKISLKTRINEIDLHELGPQQRIDWSRLYSKATQIDLVVDNPRAWVQRDLDHILDCANRKTLVRVFMASPIPDEPQDASAFAEEHLREAWKRRHQNSRGELEIYFLPKPPASFMARFDQETVIAIEAGLVDEAKTVMLLHLETEGGSDVHGWVSDRWKWAEVDGIMSTLTEAWFSRKGPRSSEESREDLGTRLDSEEVSK